MPESVSSLSSHLSDGCVSLRASGHPAIAIADVDIMCSEDPPRIGSYFIVYVPLAEARRFDLETPDKCVKVMSSTR